MAAYPMPNTRRSALWLFILLLFALACLRSLAPERTEGAVRRLLAKRNQVHDEFDEREKQLSEEKEEIQREKAALERWKIELDERRQKLDQEEQRNSNHQQLSENDVDVHQQVDEFVHSITNETTDVIPDIKTAPDPNPESPSTSDQTTEESSEIYSPDLADEPVPMLSEEECPIIVVPEHTKAGLGTQIHHIWTSLSLTLSIRNACVVLPPILADDGGIVFKPVPFHQVFDAHELSLTGLRVVPLRTCQPHGVETVIDDAGKDSAIVKTFAQYVMESHPRLAKESTLVHGDSNGIRFLGHQDIGGDPNIVGSYIRENLPEQKGRHCVGLGRMRAQVEINPDVLKFFKPAPEVAAYVDDKFPLANETLFVKLRWNKGHCDEATTRDGAVCINGDQTVPVLDYVSAIAHLAKVSGATRIYLAAPAHLPDDVSSYLATHLETVEPVLLHVAGDLFTAGLVERELAVRALRFVPDGGNWGETVLRTKKAQYPDYYVDGLDSQTMIDQWKDAGWPKDSPFLKDISAADQDQPNVEPNGQEDGEYSSTADDQTDHASRPDEYVPPSHYMPADDDDEIIREMATQGSTISAPGGEASPAEPVAATSDSSSEANSNDLTASAQDPIAALSEHENEQTDLNDDELSRSYTEPHLTTAEESSNTDFVASATDPGVSDDDTPEEEQLAAFTEQQEASAVKQDTLTEMDDMEDGEGPDIINTDSTTQDEVNPTTREGPQVVGLGQQPLTLEISDDTSNLNEGENWVSAMEGVPQNKHQTEAA